MEKEQPLNSTESLALISEMIRQAKRNYQKGGSFQFLLWGFTMMVANLGHYLLATFTVYPHPQMVWMLAIPVSIISTVYGIRMGQSTPVVSHVDRMYGHIWLAAFIGIAVSLVFMQKLNYNHNAIVLLVAGIATYITGQLLRFQPLVFGAFALFAGSVVCFLVSVNDQYLVGAIAIFAGYLIPGFLLKSKEQ